MSADLDEMTDSVHARELNEGQHKAMVPVVHNANTGDGLASGESGARSEGLSFDRWEGHSRRAAEAVKGSGILEDLEGEPLTMGERWHLAWLVNRAVKQGQLVILEGERIGINAVEGAMSDEDSTEVWIRLREGAARLAELV